MGEARVGDNSSRLMDLVGIDKNAARDHGERSFQDAHVAVGDKMLDSGLSEDRFQKGDQYRIVCPKKFFHVVRALPSTAGGGATGSLQVEAFHLFVKQLLPCPGRVSAILSAQIAIGVPVVALVASVSEKNAPQPSIQALVDLVSGGMDSVNQLILSKAGSNVDLIPEIAKHLISSGGKRLRPMLTLACADMFDYRGDGHVVLAASVEFMHTATLLHDDVVDESDMRRGKLAARKLWGNQASVLVGDYLLGQAFKMMVDVGSLEALRILSEASAIIAEGEVMQLGAAKNIATTEDQYLKVVDAKTAALFAAAAEVGPVIAGQNAVTKAAARNYGRELGLAFQLIDDALDYGGSSADLGKDIGDDFREGKITLPVVLAVSRGRHEERTFWQRCLEGNGIADGDLEEAIALMNKYDAIADTVDRARTFGDNALAALDQLPDGLHRDALADTVAFCISRVS